MKKRFTILLLSVRLLASAQTSTAEEQAQRTKADFASFIKDVKANNRAGCLCNNTEYVVFNFNTSKKKTASLCISKTVSDTMGYLVYRFGTKGKIELSFPGDTANAFSKFSFAHYNRGGGKANAAMYINSLHFTNGDFTYTLHDDWNSDDNHQAKGLLLLNNKTRKETNFDAKGKVTGTLWAFVNRNMVQDSEEY